MANDNFNEFLRTLFGAGSESEFSDAIFAVTSTAIPRGMNRQKVEDRLNDYKPSLVVEELGANQIKITGPLQDFLEVGIALSKGGYTPRSDGIEGVMVSFIENPTAEQSIHIPLVDFDAKAIAAQINQRLDAKVKVRAKNDHIQINMNQLRQLGQMWKQMKIQESEAKKADHLMLVSNQDPQLPVIVDDALFGPEEAERPEWLDRVLKEKPDIKPVLEKVTRVNGGEGQADIIRGVDFAARAEAEAKRSEEHSR